MMRRATATQSKTSSERGEINWSKGGAIIAQIASYFTTLWGVQWVWPEGATAYQALVALVIEALFVLMKSCLFNDNRRDDAVGWLGLALDAIINTGGLMPRAGRVLTFTPVAAVFFMFGVDTRDPEVQRLGGFILSVVGGILLSVLPHRLWRD